MYIILWNLADYIQKWLYNCIYLLCLTIIYYTNMWGSKNPCSRECVRRHCALQQRKHPSLHELTRTESKERDQHVRIYAASVKNFSLCSVFFLLFKYIYPFKWICEEVKNWVSYQICLFIGFFRSENLITLSNWPLPPPHHSQIKNKVF